MATTQHKIFNPANFNAPQNEEQSVAKETKEYKTTGIAARDSVRKLLFEIFNGD